MALVLVIAYGNPLRSDDGVAHRVADGLEAKFSEGDVEIVRPQQLGPELAESASRVRCVIFVDAAAAGSPGEIQIRELDLHASANPPAFGHALPPSTIVRLSEQLYGVRVRAISATVTGHNFQHGDELSNAVAEAVPVLISRLEQRIRRELNTVNSGTTKDRK